MPADSRSGLTLVEPVPRFAIDEDTPNSTMAAVAAAMQAAGMESVTYPYLMGISGTAFRFQIRESWCPSSPHSDVGPFELTHNIWPALPYDFARCNTGPRVLGPGDPVYAAIRASIQRNVPAVFMNAEAGLVVGYLESGELVSLDNYVNLRAGEAEVDWIAPHPGPFVDPFGRYGSLCIANAPKPKPPKLRENATAALELAVAMFGAGVREGDLHIGAQGWQYWLSGLQDGSIGTDDGRRHGNWWMYVNLIDARRCAGCFLRLISPEFTPQAAGHLVLAAEAYEEMASVVLPAARPAGLPASPLSVWPGWVPEWTGECRAEQARCVANALELERRALREIEEALQAQT